MADKGSGRENDGIAIARHAPHMSSDSIALKVRVILVTTRAALRHAAGDPEQRSAIVGRGRELVRALGVEVGHAEREEIDRAHAELDELERA